MTNFTKATNKWMQEVMSVKVKITTLDTYRQYMERYAQPYFMNKTIQEISREDVQFLLLHLNNKRTGELLSYSTLQGLLSVLTSFFNYLISIKKIGVNPCENVTVPKSRKRRRKIMIYSKEEQRSIVNYARREANSKSYLLLTALFTGMRLGELSSLTWEHVDIKNRKIFVETTKRRIKDLKKTIVHIDSPKTSSSVRYIPMPKMLIAYFMILKKKESKYVFCKNDGMPYDNRTIQKYFADFKIKLAISKTGFHSLRHTFATSAIESGMDVKTLSMILGHSNVAITMNLYVHPNEGHTLNAIDNVSYYIIK